MLSLDHTVCIYKVVARGYGRSHLVVVLLRIRGVELVQTFVLDPSIAIDLPNKHLYSIILLL
jgi:hypothetical protein